MLQRFNLSRTVARQHLLRAMYELGELRGNFEQPGRIKDLQARRSWSPAALRHIISRSLHGDELRESSEGGYVLTASGKDAAARIVRTHRIWEHFLTTQADIAPSHVDRAADDIEHVLSDELIRDLEQELRAIGALAEGEFVPRSPHRLAPRSVGGANPS
jgi:Mn-dependent DtxR family transcriptional regulator